MRQESLGRNSAEADDQTSRSAVICSHPWWRGPEFDAPPSLGLEIAPKSPPLNAMEASEKAGSGQSKQESNINETEAIIKRNHDKSPQGDQSHQQVATEFIIPHPQLELGHSVACAPYMYPETYYSGMVGPYGPQPMVNSQLVAMPHTRVLLPLEMAEEPVYVNAKQYHGILRRRQSRAKAELENKLIKVRKPYLHESRHQHAMRRARGCGGRFLNTKKADSSASAADSNSKSAADFLGGGGGELKTQMDQGMCEGSYPQHARFHLSSFHQSMSDERGEEGDCSGQQRSGMAVDQAPKRVLTI